MQNGSNYDVGSSLGCGYQLMGGTRPTLIKEYDTETRAITIRCLDCWTKFEGLACSVCGGLRKGVFEDAPEDYDGTW